jgi:hypothetical protein
MKKASTINGVIACVNYEEPFESLSVYYIGANTHTFDWNKRGITTGAHDAHASQAWINLAFKCLY